MIRINLLPWREAERARVRQHTIVGIASAFGLTILGGLGVHLFLNNMIEYQGERNTFLAGEISKLDRKIQAIKDLETTKARLIARMTIIQQLQESRPQAVHLIDEVVSQMPEGVYVTSMQQSGGSVALQGRAQSNARVSSLMRNVESSQWIGNPTLALVESKERTGTGLNHFSVSVQQRTPKVSGAEGGSSELPPGSASQ